MPRQSPNQVQDEILDAAARLYARHGAERTTLQQVADALGYSKAGVLHHYPNKAALEHAVLERCGERLDEALQQVGHLTLGPDRDRAVVTALVDLAMQHPGFVALLLSPVTTGELGLARNGQVPSADAPEGFAAHIQQFTELIDLVFNGQDAHGANADPDPIRELRLSAASGALAIGALTLTDVLHRPDLRTELISAAYAALGHGA